MAIHSRSAERRRIVHARALCLLAARALCPLAATLAFADARAEVIDRPATDATSNEARTAQPITPRLHLDLNAALALASANAPAIAAAHARREAAQQLMTAADALPDPQLIVGIDNLPVDGNDAGNVGRDFMTMRRVGLRQTIPSAAKRSANTSEARASVALAEAGEDSVRAQLRAAVADAWLEREGLDAQRALLQQFESELQHLQAAVSAALAAGNGAITDGLLIRSQRAALDDRVDRLASKRAQATALLRQWIGGAADAAPTTTPSPELAPDAAALRARLDRHPELVAQSAQAELAAAELARAEAALHPDWDVELAYQQRGPQFSDMVSLQISVDLPLFARSRQTPVINARSAELQAQNADRDALRRMHQAELEAGLAEYERLRISERRQRDVVLPLAEQRVTLTLHAWRAAQATLFELIDARSAALEARLEAIDLHVQRQRHAAALLFTYAEAAR